MRALRHLVRRRKASRARTDVAYGNASLRSLLKGNLTAWKNTISGELDLEMSNLLRTTIYLTDYKHFGAINAAYAKYLQEPYLVRTTIQVAGLPLGAKVQIETVVGL